MDCNNNQYDKNLLYVILMSQKAPSNDKGKSLGVKQRSFCLVTNEDGDKRQWERSHLKKKKKKATGKWNFSICYTTHNLFTNEYVWFPCSLMHLSRYSVLNRDALFFNAFSVNTLRTAQIHLLETVKSCFLKWPLHAKQERFEVFFCFGTSMQLASWNYLCRVTTFNC